MSVYEELVSLGFDFSLHWLYYPIRQSFSNELFIIRALKIAHHLVISPIFSAFNSLRVCPKLLSYKPFNNFIQIIATKKHSNQQN